MSTNKDNTIVQGQISISAEKAQTPYMCVLVLMDRCNHVCI